jgi:sugar-specific transcriptional regulator TrmB
MNQDPILLKLLADAKLEEKEAKTYLALLEAGQGTIHDIAKISELKRPILYVVLEDLIRKGYATEIPNKKIRTYQPIDPGAISSKLQTTAKNFSEMLPIFKTLANRSQKKPKISYFDTKEGIDKVFNEINHSASAIFIASIARLEEYFPGSINAWKKSYASGFNKLASRNLIPDNPEDLKTYREFAKITDLVQFRVLPNINKCDMDICVFKNKMSITTFEDKPFMVLIESNSVPDFFLPIFDILWQSAKK